MGESPEWLALVRNFQENSVKFLFRDPENAREGMTLIAPRQARVIDFARMTVESTPFITPEFRHLESDLLLRAPLRGRRGKGERPVYVYQLIEHQSEPDPLASYRVLRYVIQLFELQVREWMQVHGNTRKLRFDPVLPVIVYTGKRPWPAITPLADLVKGGKLFGAHLPRLDPVFFNLSTAGAKALRAGGVFGTVLHLMQQRHGKTQDYRAALGEAVGLADHVAASQQQRWRDLLWYFQAMVYHEREREEHAPLVAFIQAAERTQARQKELLDMGQTMAEYLRAEAKQELLLDLLRERFPNLPAEVEAQVRATKDEARLTAWSKEVLRARKLADMSFDSAN